MIQNIERVRPSFDFHWMGRVHYSMELWHRHLKPLGQTTKARQKGLGSHPEGDVRSAERDRPTSQVAPVELGWDEIYGILQTQLLTENS